MLLIILASLVFLVAFLSLKQAKRMRKNFVQSMAMQVEAQIHEESEFWSTS